MAGRDARVARPARRTGSSQNFISSGRLAAELVRDAGIGHGDLVVDIGAGAGALTAELARVAGRVLAVELDPCWVERLHERFAGVPMVRVVEADFLRWSLPAEPFAVVSNLPFAQSGAILAHLLDDPEAPLRTADVVLEWAAACKRARVWPSTLRGVLWGARFSFAVGRRLPRSSFRPRPGVDAGVLRVERRLHPLVGSGDAAAYRAFVRAGFSGRGPLRQALGAALTPRQFRRLADEVGFPRTAVARDLDAHAWASLFRAMQGGVVRPGR